MAVWSREGILRRRRFKIVKFEADGERRAWIERVERSELVGSGKRKAMPERVITTERAALAERVAVRERLGVVMPTWT